MHIIASYFFWPFVQVIRLSGYPLRPRSESGQCEVGGRQPPFCLQRPNILPRPKPAFARFATNQEAMIQEEKNTYQLAVRTALVPWDFSQPRTNQPRIKNQESRATIQQEKTHQLAVRIALMPWDFSPFPFPHSVCSPLIFYPGQNPPLPLHDLQPTKKQEQWYKRRTLTSWLSGLHLCLEIFPGSSTWGPS